MRVYICSMCVWCACEGMCACVAMSECVCVHVCLHVCVRVYMCMCMCVCGVWCELEFFIKIIDEDTEHYLTSRVDLWKIVIYGKANSH